MLAPSTLCGTNSQAPDDTSSPDGSTPDKARRKADIRIDVAAVGSHLLLASVESNLIASLKLRERDGDA